jgi:hypothetical protein
MRRSRGERAAKMAALHTAATSAAAPAKGNASLSGGAGFGKLSVSFTQTEETNEDETRCRTGRVRPWRVRAFRRRGPRPPR